MAKKVLHASKVTLSEHRTVCKHILFALEMAEFFHGGFILEYHFYNTIIYVIKKVNSISYSLSKTCEILLLSGICTFWIFAKYFGTAFLSIGEPNISKLTDLTNLVMAFYCYKLL